MDKITISVRVNRKPILPRIATILTIAGIVFSAACIQTSSSDIPPQGLSKPDFPTTASYYPLETKIPDEISNHLETPEGQSSATGIRPFPTLPGAINWIERTPETPLTGEVPAGLLREILHDLSARLKIELEKIEIVKAEQVVWNDGSLGCPQPGEVYTQALVNGYWLILEVDAVAYDYHASDRGYFFLCELPSLPGFDSPGKQPPEP